MSVNPHDLWYNGSRLAANRSTALNELKKRVGRRFGTRPLTPAFLDLHKEIWGAMKEEVLKAYQQQKVA